MTTATHPVAGRPAELRLRRAGRRPNLTPYAFVAPAYAVFLLFVAGPVVAAAYLSLTSYDLFTPPQFVGIDNYLRLGGDTRLWTTLGNTLIYVVAAVIIMNVLAVALASALNRRLPRPVLYVLRSAYFFPSLVGLVYVATIWQALFQKDTGIINYYLSFLGDARPDWLNGPDLSKVSVVIVDVWRNVGFGMLVILAALQGVDQNLVDAARVDGARPHNVFRHVILPSISPALFFNITMTFIGAFQIYESVIVLTGGGPGDASRSLVMYLAEIGFQQFDMGYASAISMLLLGILIVITAIQFRLRRVWVSND